MEKEQIVALVENTARATAAALTVKNAESFTYRGVTLKLNQRKDGSWLFEKTQLPDGSMYIPNIYGKTTRDLAEASAKKAIDDYFSKK